MPFEKNAPATVQRMVDKLVRDIDGCKGYIDNVVIYSNNWSDHVRQIKCFFQMMQEAKLTINLMKSEYGKATVKYLGRIVGQGKVRTSQNSLFPPYGNNLLDITDIADITRIFVRLLWKSLLC